MAEYLVNTADERGHVSEYVEHGASVAEVRDRFAQQGLLVTSIKPRGILGTTRSGPQKKLKLEQFVIFNQQFLTLIHAGLPILQGLDLLSKRQKKIVTCAPFLRMFGNAFVPANCFQKRFGTRLPARSQRYTQLLCSQVKRAATSKRCWVDSSPSSVWHLPFERSCWHRWFTRRSSSPW